MGNCHSCSRCCCCSNTATDTRQDEAATNKASSKAKQNDQNQPSTSISKSKSSYENIDLDALSAKIKEILTVARDPTLRNKWKPPDSSNVAQLTQFMSDRSIHGCTDDLVKVLTGDHREELNNVVTKVLIEVGRLHWLVAGFLFVGLVLERFETISSNVEECLDLLDEMFRLCGYLKEIRDIQPLREQSGDLLEMSIQLIVEGAIICCSQRESSSFFKFWGASVNKQRLENIRAQLDKIHTHLLLQVSLYSVQHIRKSGIKFPRHRFYPDHAGLEMEKLKEALQLGIDPNDVNRIQVGIETAVGEVINMLELDSDKKVVAVILHGFGGTGKTTIADAAYASIDREDYKFSKVCLFENIGVTPKITGVQKEILDHISAYKDEYEQPSSFTEGQSILLQVLMGKPCFLYIDNVLGREELRKLLPKNLFQCNKVRLLLTARDSNVRDGLSIGNPNIKIFDVPSLQRQHAIAVLGATMRAETVSAGISSEELDYILKVCGGVPLALEIIGSYIGNQQDKSEAIEAIRHEYEISGGENLALERVDFFAFAFDNIGQEYKDAFLDICSFFLGVRWHLVQRILGEDVVQLLERRALIKKQGLDWHEKISIHVVEDDVQIHDVILEIGRKRCQGNRITKLKELISILNKPEDDFKQLKGVFLQETPEMLKEQLQGNTVKLNATKLDMLSPHLRVFSTGYKDMSFAAIEIIGQCQASFKNLVFWDSPQEEPPFLVKESPGLRDFDYSPTKPVILSELPASLRHLTIRFGRVRNEKPLSAGSGVVLLNIKSVTLTIEGSSEAFFFELPEQLLIHLKQLRELFLDNFQMVSLPDELHHLQHLRILSIRNFNILKHLPYNFVKCPSLQLLYFVDCPELETLPEDLHHLSKLETLLFSGCRSLKRLPENLGLSSSLRCLNMEYCSEIEELPESIYKLPSLEFLRLEECQNLKKLSENFGNLSALKRLHLSGCGCLEHLSKNFGSLPSLKELRLSRCNALGKHWIAELVKIKSLEFVHIQESSQLIQGVQEMKATVINMKFIY